MGIHDRDYYRDDRRGWGGSELRAVSAIIALTVGVFVIQIVTSSGKIERDPLLRFGSFMTPNILEGEVWRLVTAFFVTPYSLFGIALTMLGLYWFGTELEEIYGSRRFLVFYLVAGTGVSLGQLALGAAGVDDDKWTAGARGPLFAVLVLFACHFPTRSVLLMLIVPVPVAVMVGGVVAVYVAILILAGGPKLEIAAPLIGAAIGAAYFKLATVGFGVRQGSEPRVGRIRPKLALRPEDPQTEEDSFEEAPSPVPPSRPRTGKPDEYLEAKLEAVLEKISKSGRASLTPEENAVLQRASEVYRQKGK